MKCLNTDIARSANREDYCTGRFFEGRFKCQALLAEAALLRCMAYVDLNPVRAGMARTAEASTHTSFAHRVKTKRNGLLPFAVRSDAANILPKLQSTLEGSSIPFTFDDYRTLVGWTVDNLKSKRFATPPRLLGSMNIDAGGWQKTMRPGALERARALGAPRRLRAFAAAIGQAWIRGDLSATT